VASLNTYLKDVYRLLRDPRQDMLNPLDLVAHINTARREVAMRAQCVRDQIVDSDQPGVWVQRRHDGDGDGSRFPVRKRTFP
jgi:hypothetical protein